MSAAESPRPSGLLTLCRTAIVTSPTRLWLVRVPGSDVVEVERAAAVRVDGLPEGWEVESIDPPQVQVKLSGTRWNLFRSRGQPVTVRIDALMAQLGRRTFPITPALVEHPAEVEPVDVRPPNVKLSLRRREPETAGP